MSIYNQLHALVREIDSRVERKKAAASAATSRQVSTPIPGGAGTVTVSGSGQLISVELDRQGLGGTNGTALGRKILQTITDAESRATAETHRLVEEADQRIQ